MSTATNPNTPPRDSSVSTTTNGQAPVNENGDGQAPGVPCGATSLTAAHDYLASPLVDSYHTVWFELHEELIELAGSTREAEAAREPRSG